MTHRFHPWCGRVYEFVARRRNWGEDRVYFHDERGALQSVPTGWTDMADVDPFVVMAAGRCPFRVEDLLALADLADQLRPARGKPSRASG